MTPERAAQIAHEKNIRRLGVVASAHMPMKTALEQIISATNAYLPPDGITKRDFISRVIAATDNPEINATMLALKGAAE